MSKTILVATDGSPTSRDAMTFAVELAAEHDWKVVFVHVIPLMDIAPAYGWGEVSAAWPHEPTERDHELLKEAAQFAAEHGVAAATALLGGPTATE
ncbi:MAG TPA: universal stress protein, partial [Ilumatobacteraceae bacterium]|nr:universal stress protein [Ilumatobacteraceae bacterium]